MKTYWITALLAIAMTAGAEDTITLKVKVKDGLFYPGRLTARRQSPEAKRHEWIEITHQQDGYAVRRRGRELLEYPLQSHTIV